MIRDVGVQVRSDKHVMGLPWVKGGDLKAKIRQSNNEALASLRDFDNKVKNGPTPASSIQL